MFKKYFTLVAIYSFLVFTAIFFYPKKFSQSTLSSRNPSGLVTSGFLAIAEDIYQVGATLGGFPVEAVKKIAIELGVSNYLADLPLDPEVRARVTKRLDDDRYMSRVIPFLLALRTQYTEPKDVNELKFESYLRTDLSLRLPGSDHELFNWAPPEKRQIEGFTLPQDVAGNLVSIYDSIFILGKSTVNDNEDLEKPFAPLSEKDQPLIDRTKPLVRKLLVKLKENADKPKIKSKESKFDSCKDLNKTKPGEAGDANSEIMLMLADLIAVDQKLEAATISIIDFVRYMVHKSYRFFSLKLIREIELKKWLYEKLDKNRFDDIIGFIDAADERKYAAQFGVDGLQGGLLKALAEPTRNEAFLNATVREVDSAESLKPKMEPVSAPNHCHNIRFLKHVAKEKVTPDSYLPFFKFIFKNYIQNISSGGISTTPTISVRNLPIIFTGADVAGPNSTGIPNFHFVDRKDPKYRGYYFYGNDALMLDQLTAQNGMITMFERLRSVSTLNCNAQYEWHSQASLDGLLNLGIGEGDRDFGEVRCYNELRTRAAKEVELRNARKQLRILIVEMKSALFNVTRRHRARQLFDAVAHLEQEGMPQYLLAYFPWPDHFAHFKGPFSNEIVSSTGELNRLDYWLSKYTETYKAAGIYPRTLFGMAGDHGLSPIFHTLNPEKTVLENLSKDLNRKILIKKISSDEGKGPQVNHNLKPEPLTGLDVVIASTAGGNYMMDFFNGQDDASWRRQPIYSELTKLKLLDGGPAIDIVSEIAARLSETLEYLAVREADCSPSECHTRLVATRDGQRVNDFVIRKGDRIFYVPYDWAHEKSLLELGDVSPYHRFSENEINDREDLLRNCLQKANSQDPDTWCDESTWRKIASFTSRPDSVVQIAHLFDEDRAGTINLFPRPGIGYNTTVPGRHAGESFHEKDAFIGFWGEPTRNQGVTPLGPTVIGSLAPTIYNYLSGADLTNHRGNFGFPSVWKEVQK